MTTECLLFDCDGTLVDSERLCSIGLAIKFKELGVALDAEQLQQRFRGWKLANILQCLSEEAQCVLSDNFVSSYRASLAELFKKELQPITGIAEALALLPQAKAVVSNAPLEKIQLMLQICKLDGFFNDKLFSAYDAQCWKPDPALYQLAAKNMGYAVSACAAIEDGEVGVQAALGAGINTFHYLPDANKTCEGLQPPAQTRTGQGVTVFRTMSALPALLNSQ